MQSGCCPSSAISVDKSTKRIWRGVEGTCDDQLDRWAFKKTDALNRLPDPFPRLPSPRIFWCRYPCVSPPPPSTRYSGEGAGGKVIREAFITARGESREGAGSPLFGRGTDDAVAQVCPPLPPYCGPSPRIRPPPGGTA